MIFAMAGPCRPGWQAVCPSCRGFADLFAGFAQNGPAGFGGLVRTHDLMITDEY
jgi:hypothetical protein